MHQVRTSVCTIVILSILAATARADVIGSTPAPPKVEHGAMADRMQATGMTEATVRSTLDRMAPQDLAYFSLHPDRIQVVGAQEVQNLWYETVFGGAFLVAMTALAIGIVIHNRDT